jgi:hypothetical protein
MANTNIAQDQGGDTFRLGSKDGIDRLYDHWDVSSAWSGAGALGRLGYFTDFLGDTFDATLAVDLAASSTAALNAQQSGVLRVTTNAAAGAHGTVALGLHWLVSTGVLIAQFRVKQVTAITDRIVEVGLSDALTETNGRAFSSHDATPVDVATNAAIFGYNSAEDAVFNTLSVNAGTPQYAASTHAPSTSYSTLTVTIDAAGNARFYVGDPPVLVATHLLAVATTALLTPWISISSIAGAAAIQDVDFFTVHGAR